MTLHFQFHMFKFGPCVSVSCNLSYKSTKDVDYALGLFFENPKSNGKLDNMWLSPHTKKWYLNSYFATQELRLECMSVSPMKNLPYKKLFVTNMSNAPNTPIL
jgi:hypothetical protein